MEFTGFTIDIDTGSTFTDGFMTAGDRVELVKVDTTPHDLTVCLLNCIEEGAKRFGLRPEELLSKTSVIRYSTTVGTNSLLQKKGPKLGVIVTEGFADTLYASADKASEVLTGIVQTNMRIGLKEKTDSYGKVVQPLDEKALRQAVEYLLDSGARSLVVSLKNSAINATHEQKAKAIVDSEYPRHYLGSLPVLTASAITSHHDDHVRTNTAVLKRIFIETWCDTCTAPMRF